MSECMQLTYTGSPATFKAIIGLASGNITVVGSNFSCTSSKYGAFAVGSYIAACADQRAVWVPGSCTAIADSKNSRLRIQNVHLGTHLMGAQYCILLDSWLPSKQGLGTAEGTGALLGVGSLFTDDGTFAGTGSFTGIGECEGGKVESL